MTAVRPSVQLEEALETVETSQCTNTTAPTEVCHEVNTEVCADHDKTETVLVPAEGCRDVTEQACHETLQPQCSDLPKQVVSHVPVQECSTSQADECSPVTRQESTKVRQKKCWTEVIKTCEHNESPTQTRHRSYYVPKKYRSYHGKYW